MTEKVKLTREQAEAIERYKRELVNSIDEQLRFGVKRTPYEWVEPLFELGGEQVLESIRYGYEVKPDFEVGDWVYVGWFNGAGVYEVAETEGITTITGTPAIKIHHDGNNIAPIEITRHATPEEIAEEKQRRIWSEIEEGDVLRKVPMAHDIAIYEGDADDESILVRNETGQHLWRKSQVELYAKKVGGDK